jgi:hypothetical protein
VDHTEDVNESGRNVPFELVLEVAAFCAGAFDFKTYLQVSLCCKELHQALKSVLEQPIAVWDSNSPFSTGFRRACMTDQVDDYLRTTVNGLPRQASFWPKVQCVWHLSGRLENADNHDILRYLVIYGIGWFSDFLRADLGMFRLFPRLQCAISVSQAPPRQ